MKYKQVEVRRGKIIPSFFFPHFFFFFFFFSQYLSFVLFYFSSQGSFSNPNAHMNVHTLSWLASLATGSLKFFSHFYFYFYFDYFSQKNSHQKKNYRKISANNNNRLARDVLWKWKPYLCSFLSF